MFFVTDPERFDVVVTDNLFGDIITDIGAAIAGGIGRAASGNLDVSGTNPSMFEPVHGSAPDIAGQQKADPTATVLSVAMLLDHLGLDKAAAAGRAGGLRRPRRTRETAYARPHRSATTSPPRSPREDLRQPVHRRPPTASRKGSVAPDVIALDRAQADLASRCRTRSGRRSWPAPGSAGTSPTTW